MKAKVIIPIVLVCLVLALLFIPMKREINETYTCNVLDQKDAAYSGETTVTFTGTYRDSLLFADTFTGRVEIKGHPLLSEYAADVELSVKDHQLCHVMNYVPGIVSNQVDYPATFYGAEDLKSFFFWVNEPTGENCASGRYFVCYPAMTIEEVYRLLDNS